MRIDFPRATLRMRPLLYPAPSCHATEVDNLKEQSEDKVEDDDDVAAAKRSQKMAAQKRKDKERKVSKG